MLARIFLKGLPHPACWASAYLHRSDGSQVRTFRKKRTCTTCINCFIESFASGHSKGLTHIGDTVQQYHLLYRSEDHDKAVLVSFVSSRVTVCSITFGTRSQHGILWQSSPSQFPIKVFQPSSNQVQVNSQPGPKARLR